MKSTHFEKQKQHTKTHDKKNYKTRLSIDKKVPQNNNKKHKKQC